MQSALTRKVPYSKKVASGANEYQRNQTLLWELYGAGVGTYPSLCNNKVSTAQQSVGKAAATRGGKGRCPVHVSPIYMGPNGSKGLPSVHINVNSSIPQ